ncbi:MULTISPECIES: hypothetical protein [Mycobacterium]
MRDRRHAATGTESDRPVIPEKGSIMALDDDDITTAGGDGGEGTADGGSNPEGHDGGADGTASEGSKGEGPADGGSNPEGHDGGADGTA